MAKLTQMILPVLENGSVVMKTYTLGEGGSGGTGAPEDIGIGYGVCTTAYATTAKTATLTGYELTENGIVAIKFANNVNANATLNINNEGAKPIYYRGQPIVEGIIKVGDIVTFIYDGTNYNILTTDNPWRAEIQIESDPDAVITITNTTYSLTDTVACDSEGKGYYICKAPGTYVFTLPED